MTSSTFDTSKIEKMINFQFTDMDTTIKKYAAWFIADLK
jgi:hypothetical protein